MSALNKHLESLNEIINQMTHEQFTHMEHTIKREVFMCAADSIPLDNPYIDALRDMKLVLTGAANELNAIIDKFENCN
jgi:hypothetical protein